MEQSNPAPHDPAQVVEFWKQAGQKQWFSKDDEFDRRFRDTFLSAHEAAARGELDGWLAAADSTLALLLLLDQFPRNSFRGTPRMFETDAKAREVANLAIERAYDRAVDPELRLFVYLPLGHSEVLADQERGCSLGAEFPEQVRKFAEGHRDIIRRFGRFPHRNAVLGRESTPEELEFLAQGGFAG